MFTLFSVGGAWYGAGVGVGVGVGVGASVDVVPVVVGGCVALAGEPQLAVELLVLDHVHQVGKHLSTIAANQDIGTT